jgi:hypothetical protein
MLRQASRSGSAIPRRPQAGGPARKAVVRVARKWRRCRTGPGGGRAARPGAAFPPLPARHPGPHLRSRSDPAQPRESREVAVEAHHLGPVLHGQRRQHRVGYEIGRDLPPRQTSRRPSRWCSPASTGTRPGRVRTAATKAKASSRGVGTKHPRGWAERRRKDHHTPDGTASCPPLASRTSSHLRATGWSGCPRRGPGGRVHAQRPHPASVGWTGSRNSPRARFERRSRPGRGPVPAPEHGHLGSTSPRGLGELTAEGLLDQPAQRRVPPRGGLRCQEQLVVDGEGGAHDIGLRASPASADPRPDTLDR